MSSAELVRGPEGVDIVPRQVEVAKEEPLKAELETFIVACRGADAPIVNGRTAAAALAAAITIREQVEGRSTSKS